MLIPLVFQGNKLKFLPLEVMVEVLLVRRQVLVLSVHQQQ
jgi:hypothetical protein